MFCGIVKLRSQGCFPFTSNKPTGNVQGHPVPPKFEIRHFDLCAQVCRERLVLIDVAKEVLQVPRLQAHIMEATRNFILGAGVSLAHGRGGIDQNLDHRCQKLVAFDTYMERLEGDVWVITVEQRSSISCRQCSDGFGDCEQVRDSNNGLLPHQKVERSLGRRVCPRKAHMRLPKVDVTVGKHERDVKLEVVVF